MATVESRCGFCGEAEGVAGRLIRGPCANICRQCVARTQELLGEEDLAPKFTQVGVQSASAAAQKATSVRPVAVIPARFAAVRFPGKPLALLQGKPMVQHVYERCVASGAFSQVIVATEDARIALAVRGFGGEVAMTSPSCPSGTDRVAEVARELPGVHAFLNIQGDEPLVHPESLRTLAEAFADPTLPMATLVRPLEPDEHDNPNVVKVVLRRSGDALYFSRANIPYARDGKDSPGTVRYAHLGLYGFRRDVLLNLSELPPTPLELTERLEQLRALEHGVSIRCLRTEHKSLGVDSPEDLARAEEMAARQTAR